MEDNKEMSLIAIIARTPVSFGKRSSGTIRISETPGNLEASYRSASTNVEDNPRVAVYSLSNYHNRNTSSFQHDLGPVADLIIGMYGKDYATHITFDTSNPPEGLISTNPVHNRLHETLHPLSPVEIILLERAVQTKLKSTTGSASASDSTEHIIY